MRVRVVTDSSASVPDEYLARLGIGEALATVNFGSESYFAKAETPLETFYRRIETADKLPTTSQPTPEQFRGRMSERPPRAQTRSWRCACRLNSAARSIARLLRPKRRLCRCWCGTANTYRWRRVIRRSPRLNFRARRLRQPVDPGSAGRHSRPTLHGVHASQLALYRSQRPGPQVARRRGRSAKHQADPDDDRRTPGTGGLRSHTAASDGSDAGTPCRDHR